MCRKTILVASTITALAIGICNNNYAQQHVKDSSVTPIRNFNIHAGISASFTNCITDIGTLTASTVIKRAQPSAGAFATIMYQNIIAARLEYFSGTVEAYDSDNEKGSGRYGRNLSFRSKISEFSFLLEWHPIKLMSDRITNPKISPYIAGGVGYFKFNPKARINNTWHELQPLRTEGQGFLEYPTRKMYDLQQFNFPVGFGILYHLSNKVNIRGEFIYRILNTDYLDDASSTFIDPTLTDRYLPQELAGTSKKLQSRGKEIDPTYSTGVQNRGSGRTKDAYYSVNIKVGIRLK